MTHAYGSDVFTYNFKAALAAASVPRQPAEHNPYWFEDLVCDSQFLRGVSHGYGVPTKSNHGKPKIVPPVGRAALEKHRQKFGPECVSLPDERRTVSELRESGLSVREIARVRGIPERSVKAQLRAAA